MSHGVYARGLRLLLLGSVSWLPANGGGSAPARLTAAAAGPYRVAGNRIVDAKGRAYLARGTALPTLTLNPADVAGDGKELGPFSASAFVSIRHRLNMNAVRLPVSPLLFQASGDYRARVRAVVESANRFELLVILGADPAGPADLAEQIAPPALAHFWTHCATEFRNHPNVFFALAPTPAARADAGWGTWQLAIQPLVDAVRAAGAAQPVLVAGFDPEGFTGLTPEFEVRGANVIYQATPRYAATRTDEDRARQFGFLAARAPVLIDDLDPQLDRNSAECAAFPADPGAATKLVQENLAYFDAHQVSWVLSSFRPGRMLTEYRYFNWSKLDDGWTCGEDPSHGGIATVLAAHLLSTDPHGLFVVNQGNGGLVLARGGMAAAYGPTLAEREVTAPAGHPWPLRLANLGIRVTDSRGIARLARLRYVGAGWAFMTFVVPATSAPGPAEVAVVRSDGSSAATNIVIADVAPGFISASGDARGAAVGQVVQRATATGQTKKFAASECVPSGCRAQPIPLSAGVVTTVRLEGTGIRNAGAVSAIRATVGGRAVPVLSFSPAEVPDEGRDYVTVQLPIELRGVGETDLVMTVNGALSNVVRINCGAL